MALPTLAFAQAAIPAASQAPAAAQGAPGAPQGDGESVLTGLIPDSAVAKPEVWAKAVSPPAAIAPAALPPLPGQPGTTPVEAPLSSAPVSSAPLSPSSPMAELRGFSVAWPDKALDLPELAALPSDGQSIAPPPSLTTLTLAAPVGAKGGDQPGMERLDRLAAGRVVLAWHNESGSIPERSELETRFRGFSSLQTMPGKEADDLAQFAVRAAADRDVLVRLFRTYGYYDAEVSQTLESVPGKSAQLVRFDIVPGMRYRFGVIDLGALASAGADYPALRKSFAIVTGDPLHADAIPAQTEHLDAALGESGYAFAHIDPPALTVDHLREEGDLALPVKPGDKYFFGPIISANPRFLSSRHLAQIARFHPGQLYKRSAVDDLRRAILATGLVSSLTVTPRAESVPSAPNATPSATPPETVALDVSMTPAPARTISGAIGYDTAQGFRLEGGWENRNLFPPEGSLRLRGVAGTNEQLAGVTFRRANFHGRDRTLSFDLTADNATLPAYASRAVDLMASYERATTLLFQKPWSWSLGLEVQASDEREGVPSGIITGRTAYFTLAAPLRASWDRSNDLLDPHKGYRVSLRVSPEMSEARGLTSTYARIQLDASWYQPAVRGVVLAARLRLGSMPGTDLENIAPSRRFYAGGGGSIRGFGFELVGPRNAQGEPEGGRSLYEASLEARINTGLMQNALQLVPFFDSGGAGTGTVPDFKAMRYGAGLGMRYETGFGPVRLDVGTPIDRRPGESRIGVYVTLGQAF